MVDAPLASAMSLTKHRSILILSNAIRVRRRAGDAAPDQAILARGGEGARQKAEQLECRRKAAIAKVLPRDWTAYVIRCLADDEQKPAQ